MLLDVISAEKSARYLYVRAAGARTVPTQDRAALLQRDEASVGGHELAGVEVEGAQMLLEHGPRKNPLARVSRASMSGLASYAQVGDRPGLVVVQARPCRVRLTYSLTQIDPGLRHHDRPGVQCDRREAACLPDVALFQRGDGAMTFPTGARIRVLSSYGASDHEHAEGDEDTESYGDRSLGAV